MLLFFHVLNCSSKEATQLVSVSLNNLVEVDTERVSGLIKEAGDAARMMVAHRETFISQNNQRNIQTLANEIMAKIPNYEGYRRIATGTVIVVRMDIDGRTVVAVGSNDLLKFCK